MEKESKVITEIVEESAQDKQEASARRSGNFSPKVIADEVSKILMSRLPGMLTRPRRKKVVKKVKKIEEGIFLDTSAIIDGRIFDVIYTGLLNGVIVLLPSVLLELKHLADSQDLVKRERGRKGLEALEKLRKWKKIKVLSLSDEEEQKHGTPREVDERLIKVAKGNKGKILTCDYNLEKKATIENVVTININALANCLKVIAVPGESLHIKLSHQGKDPTQGVGYLDDGTMIVVEQSSDAVGTAVDVVVSRVIQKETGRILFAKRI
jgi:uncharacterized protein YacL